ncbi:SRPBCC family protein [Rhodobacter sp. Har01]|uniref:SRPBCC family protein n=1 Tax=Rhodobacter sp. Har01 TaxID=2883999 RepID=UPI001D07DE6B|nr:SRPBCC family protein [Rhodobacter sp. Har01]MCB6176652.1 SRPBCC family protein [Rhodobacter sp. Har01]
MLIDPETDLDLIRHLDAPPAKVWRCWTEPKLLEQWFAPKPVVTRDVVIELVPGGSFKTVMDVPGQGEMPGHGCILEVVPQRRLVWTDLMQGGWRPNAESFGFTAFILLEPEGDGTLYRAVALHRSRGQRDEHEKMGFHDGWGTATAQLGALALTL